MVHLQSCVALNDVAVKHALEEIWKQGSVSQRCNCSAYLKGLKKTMKNSSESIHPPDWHTNRSLPDTKQQWQSSAAMLSQTHPKQDRKRRQSRRTFPWQWQPINTRNRCNIFNVNNRMGFRVKVLCFWFILMKTGMYGQILAEIFHANPSNGGGPG